jgi:hypothetical protein
MGIVKDVDNIRPFKPYDTEEILHHYFDTFIHVATKTMLLEAIRQYNNSLDIIKKYSKLNKEQIMERFKKILIENDPKYNFGGGKKATYLEKLAVEWYLKNKEPLDKLYVPVNDEQLLTEDIENASNILGRIFMEEQRQKVMKQLKLNKKDKDKLWTKVQPALMKKQEEIISKARTMFQVNSTKVAEFLRREGLTPKSKRIRDMM